MYKRIVMATKKTPAKAVKKAVNKVVKKVAPKKRAPKKRAIIKKDGNLFILYVDGTRRRAFRSKEDAERYIEKRHLNGVK